MDEATYEDQVDEIVGACQSWVNQLWNFDDHHASNEDEARDVIKAVKDVMGIELHDPWEKTRSMPKGRVD